MTSRARKNHVTESSTNEFGDVFAAWNLFDGPFAKMLEHNRTLTEHTLKALQEESLRFVNARLEHTSRAIEDSRDCTGISGLLSVQHDWLASFAHDYAEQSKRFADVLRDIAERSKAVLSETAAAAPTHLRVHKNEHSERQAA